MVSKDKFVKCAASLLEVVQRFPRNFLLTLTILPSLDLDDLIRTDYVTDDGDTAPSMG